MRFLIIAAASVALLSASAAVPSAQAQSSSQGLPVSGGGNDAPGGLTAHDVVGKRLSDADGNVIGQIVGVSQDGTTAQVKPGKGAPTTVAMNQLSLGTGARQVILGGEPNAPPPHYNSQSSSVTSTTTAPTIVVVPPQ